MAKFGRFPARSPLLKEKFINHTRKFVESTPFRVLLFWVIFSLAAGCVSNPAGRRPSSGCGVNYKQYFQSQQNVDKLNKSTVAILKVDGLGRVEGISCTAFFVRPDVLATASHCVVEIGEPEKLQEAFGTLLVDTMMKSKKIYILDYETSQTTNLDDQELLSKTLVAKIVSYNPGFEKSPAEDFALLKLEPEQKKSKNWLTIRKTGAKKGEPAYTAGMPYGLPWVLAEGMVAGKGKISSYSDKQAIFLDVYAGPGRSGSPVIGTDGKVIGVLTVVFSKEAGGRSGSGLSGAADAVDLIEFLNKVE